MTKNKKYLQRLVQGKKAPYLHLLAENLNEQPMSQFPFSLLPVGEMWSRVEKIVESFTHGNIREKSREEWERSLTTFNQMAAQNPSGLLLKFDSFKKVYAYKPKKRRKAGNGKDQDSNKKRGWFRPIFETHPVFIFLEGSPLAVKLLREDSHFALRLLRDHLLKNDGCERFKKCSECGRWFVDTSNNKRAERCSPNCTSITRIRKVRAKKRASRNEIQDALQG